MKLSEVPRRTVDKPVTIRGKEFRIRAVSAAESRAVRLAFPEPAVPMKKDPTKGSLTTDEVPDRTPAYLAESRDQRFRFAVGELAIALGWETVGGRAWSNAQNTGGRGAAAGTPEEFLTIAVAEITGEFSEAEIDELYDALKKFGVAEQLGEALKN